MRKGYLHSLAALATGAGLAWGQSAPPAVTHAGYEPVPEPASILPVGGCGPAGCAPGMGGFGGPGCGPAGPVPAYTPDGAPISVIPPPVPNGVPLPYLTSPKPPSRPACEHIFFTYESLLWEQKSDRTPYPLVTTSAPTSAGALGVTSTSVLFGDRKLSQDTFSGWRATGGFWCNPDRVWGFMGSGFLTEKRSIFFNAASDGNGIPTIARPVIEASTLTPTALLVSLPTAVNGSVAVVNESQAFGAEGNVMLAAFRTDPSCDDWFRLNLLAGFRYFQLDEDLDISSSSFALPGTPVTFDQISIEGPVFIDVNDHFKTRNQFYGGQVGFQTEYHHCRWSINVTGKVAIGNMHQRLDINGSSTLTGVPLLSDDGSTSFGGPLPRGVSATQPAVIRGGLLALGTNIGQYNNDEFAVVPEVTAQVGYQICSWLTGHIGYNWLYATRVIRPGAQIDPIVNATLVPTDASYGVGGGPLRPAPLVKQSDYFLQGINFGLTVKY